METLCRAASPLSCINRQFSELVSKKRSQTMVKKTREAAKSTSRGYDRSVHLGNAGEHLVMAHLLALGYQAFMADRGNPAFDISVVCEHRHSLIRVKSTSTNSVVWTRKKSGATFLDLREDGDYCCIVDLRKGVRDSRIYIIPTMSVQAAIDEGRRYWTSSPKKDGTQRVDTKGQRLWLNSRTDRHAYEGFETKWHEYLDAWNQLS